MLALSIALKTTGALFLTYHCVLRPLVAFYHHFIRCSYNLNKRYGNKTWVLVTGGSDGIGKGYATEFAKRGFNIFLIARNEEKLKQVTQEIEKKYTIETKYMSKDFSRAHEEGFFNDIFEETKELDVSVLINNVGLANMKSLPVAEMKDVKDL